MADVKKRQRSVSPPCYQVYQTKDGRLVNRTLRVEWPNPPMGNQKLFDGYIVKPELPSLSSDLQPLRSVSSSAQLFAQSDSSNCETGRNTHKFIGSATFAFVNEHLSFNDFVIFYPTSDLKNGDSLPSKIPLLLAYRSSQGKIYYLPIKRQNHQWTIKFGKKKNCASFVTMQDLIQHYYTYGFLDPANGNLDIFRVNLLEDLSTSSETEESY